MEAALAVVLAIVFLLSVLLDKTLHSLPPRELRRRARGRHDKRPAAVYKLSSYGRSAIFFIRLCAALSAAGLILIATAISWWAGLLAALVVMALIWSSQTPGPINGWRLWAAAIAAPVFSAIVAFLQPVLGRLTDWLNRLSPPHPPVSIFEKEDLLEFLRVQARQPNNRISTEELKIARSALSLSEKTVGDVMLPRHKVKWVTAGDSISPMVMDELHQSGQTRFPVVKEITKATSPEIVGALYLADLLDHLEDKGRIRDIMHPGVRYINESHDLLSTLDGFLKSGQLLLIVVNNFEEVVGVMSLEVVLEQIFGAKISQEFDRYHDIRSVAGANNGQPAEAEVE